MSPPADAATDLPASVLTLSPAALYERIAAAVVASAGEAVLVCAREGIVTHANAAARQLAAQDPVGRPFAEAVPLVFPGANGLMAPDEIVAMALRGTPLQGLAAQLPNAEGAEASQNRDLLVNAVPLELIPGEAGEAGRAGGAIVTLVDLTPRREAERQRLLLMRELDHRVKNTLALVLSIGSRTAHHEETLEGFQRAFAGRIQALAAAHNLLADNSWSNLTLEDLVRTEIAPSSGTAAARVRTEGLDIAVAPRAAIAFGLVVHELTTNAVKFGALSVADGTVSLTRVAMPSEARNALVLEWREQGGPPVTAPGRRGFGQTVISRSLRYSGEGGAELSFEPDGVRCEIRIPAEDLRERVG
ncbi:sensor histidine kinase [Ancylobacter sp. 6x-1]|uniref:histidine kinase n=1 Tax=Ancylobacter crimeensis TaxID=2579147 RepID=A0ABT0D7C0_9HYPH|nr:sensor histidine kinase [Ancylobacter crimeensis]MCK0195845.1 sensor histidine kinase [Ancylobacter crimeensis]